MLEKLPRRPPVSLVDHLGDREPAGAVDSHKHVEFALGGLPLRDVDLQEADRMALEGLRRQFVTFDFRQAGNAITLEAAVQR